MPDTKNKKKYDFQGMVRKLNPNATAAPAPVTMRSILPMSAFEKAMTGGEVISNQEIEQDNLEREWDQLEEELLGG